MVRNVIDGDTIVARIGGKDETVRIIGMDSPETHKPNTPVECFATEATDAARRLMPKGARVTLRVRPDAGHPRSVRAAVWRTSSWPTALCSRSG